MPGIAWVCQPRIACVHARVGIRARTWIATCCFGPDTSVIRRPWNGGRRAAAAKAACGDPPARDCERERSRLEPRPLGVGAVHHGQNLFGALALAAALLEAGVERLQLRASTSPRKQANSRIAARQWRQEFHRTEGGAPGLQRKEESLKEVRFESGAGNRQSWRGLRGSSRQRRRCARHLPEASVQGVSLRHFDSSCGATSGSGRVKQPRECWEATWGSFFALSQTLRVSMQMKALL